MRISVLGAPGSGKSHFSKRIGEVTGIEVIRMSDIIPTREGPAAADPFEVFLSSKEGWIADGFLSQSIPCRLKLSDLVVVLDVPFHVCIVRAFVRSVRNLFSRDKIVHSAYSATLCARICYLASYRTYLRIFIFYLRRRKILFAMIAQGGYEAKTLRISNRNQYESVLEKINQLRLRLPLNPTG